MDCSVIAERYLNLGLTDAAHNLFVNLKKSCQIVGGNFTLLWHNSELYNDELKMFYKNIVNDCVA